MFSLRRLALAFVPLLAIAACSSDSVDAGRYIDAVAADVRADDSELQVDEAEATCIAEAMVGAADAERLDEAGVTPLEFADAESFQSLDIDFDDDALRADLAASLGSCELGESLAKLLVSSFPGDVAEDDISCIASSLDDGDELAAGLAAALVDGDDAGISDALTVSLAACPSVTGNLLAETVGDAGITVDAEARACFIDEMEARGEEAVDQLLTGGAAAETLGTELGEACLPDAG